MLLRVEGCHEEAQAAALGAIEHGKSIGPGNMNFKTGFVEATEQSLTLGDLSRVEELLAMTDELRPATVTRFLRGHTARFRARLAAARGEDDQAEPAFKSAADMFRELGNPFWLAVTLLERGEWCVEQGRAADAQPLLEEASTIFEGLRARPWSERLDRARAHISRTDIEQVGSAS